MKKVRIALSIVLIAVFGYIIIGEIVFPYNTPMNGNICKELPNDNWLEIKQDGTKVPFMLPGNTESDITLETILPTDFDKDYNVLCFRGMDMEIFIDDELRQVQETTDYQFFGDRSAECYVMASIYPEDAGKTLRVHYEYDCGMVYEVYIGTRIGILNYLFEHYGFELMVGLSILLLGTICLIAAVSYRAIYKRYLEMEHLSLGVILGACWVLSNSIFRQLYTRNISVMSDMPFLMVMVMPLPFLIFINSLQKGRYKKLLIICSIIELSNAGICMLLFLIGKVNLVDSFTSSAICSLISILTMISTVIIDIVKHQVYEYRFVAIGFFLLAIAASFQLVLYQAFHNGVFSGLIMSVGLFGFLICSIIHTIKQLIGIRVESSEIAHISKAKDDFLANISHEIRTPLNGILGIDEMILRDTKENKIKKYALEIKSAGNTLLSIINDILDLSKIESGNFEIIPVEYDLASVLNDVLNLTRYRAAKKQLHYSYNVSENIPSTLYGDEIRIRQIMLNIINNAIKYTPEGQVEINISSRFTRMNNYIDLIVEVKDTGMGIKDEDKDKLFNSFQRLDEKKNRSIEGTGLGLHITQRVLEMMEGRIEFESEYGKGSTFWVIVPQKVVKATPIGNFSKAVKNYLNNLEVEEVALYAPDARILVVDDNEMNLAVMEGLLRDTKIQCDFVSSGQMCIEKVQNNKYDCILLDQMMPEMSGEATLSEMMRMDILHNTPVIVLTADAIMGARENYLSMGFTDYLSKPVKYSMLEQYLKEYIPQDKQKIARPDDELPVMLIWGNDSARLRTEKERLDGIYKCVCVVGEKARNKYFESHIPAGELHLTDVKL